jgi:hypothetical protein
MLPYNYEFSIFWLNHKEPRYCCWYNDWLQAERSSSPGKNQEFSLLHIVQTGSVAHPASCRIGIDGTDSQSASPSWCQAPIRDTRPIFFLLEILFGQFKVRYFVAPSLTRGWVCNLLLLLVIACAFPLESGSRGTLDHILLSQFLRLPQPGEPGPCIYIPQEQGGSVISPGTGFPFRRLLRLAGLRWRYYIPPPHGLLTTDLKLVLISRKLGSIRPFPPYVFAAHCCQLSTGATLPLPP